MCTVTLRDKSKARCASSPSSNDLMMSTSFYAQCVTLLIYHPTSWHNKIGLQRGQGVKSLVYTLSREREKESYSGHKNARNLLLLVKSVRRKFDGFCSCYSARFQYVVAVSMNSEIYNV